LTQAECQANTGWTWQPAHLHPLGDSFCYRDDIPSTDTSVTIRITGDRLSQVYQAWVHAGDPVDHTKFATADDVTNCGVPPPTNVSATCNYFPAPYNSFIVRKTWTAPTGYSRFANRLTNLTGTHSLPAAANGNFATTSPYVLRLSNEQAVGTVGYDFNYDLRTIWTDPSDPTNESLFRFSVAAGRTLACPLPVPLAPDSVSTNGICPDNGFTSNTNTGTIRGFAQFAQRYNLTVQGIDGNPYSADFTGIVFTPPFELPNLPWGRYRFTLVGENTTRSTDPENPNAVQTGPLSPGITFSCLPPDPTLTLTARDQIVRRGAATRLTWNLEANYTMSCNLTGGGLTHTFTHAGTPTAFTGTGSIDTSAINNTTIYTLRCTPQVPNLTLPAHSTTIRVEVVPQGQEI
jgi:hypothetical protein